MCVVFYIDHLTHNYLKNNYYYYFERLIELLNLKFNSIFIYKHT